MAAQVSSAAYSHHAPKSVTQIPWCEAGNLVQRHKATFTQSYLTLAETEVTLPGLHPADSILHILPDLI